MKRVVKDPEVRKNELIDVATELFMKKGYEETSISDIVKKAKVAQGTFYYYFESKEQIIDAIVEKFQNEILDLAEKLVDDKKLNSIEKFLKILQFKMKISSGGKKFWKYVLSENSTILHIKFEKNLLPKFSKPLSRIIEQGVKEGFFDCKYPDFAALYILNVNISIGIGADFYSKSVEEQKKLIIIVFDMIERILGAKPGLFFDYMKKQNMEVEF